MASASECLLLEVSACSSSPKLSSLNKSNSDPEDSSATISALSVAFCDLVPTLIQGSLKLMTEDVPLYEGLADLRFTVHESR